MQISLIRRKILSGLLGSKRCNGRVRDLRIVFAFGALCFLAVISTFAQRPVRGSVFKTTPPLQAEKQINPEKENSDNRFLDTVRIAIGDANNATTIDEDYQNAIELYQGKQYGESCAIFSRLEQNLSRNHQLLPDIKFMRAECAAVQGRLNDALKILMALLEDSATPRVVLEKTIVRTGHVYCGLGNADKASELFARLKREFPNSAYLRVAACDAIE